MYSLRDIYGFKFIADRELIYVDDHAFVKAKIEMIIPNPYIRRFSQLFATFNISEILSDATISKC